LLTHIRSSGGNMRSTSNKWKLNCVKRQKTWATPRRLTYRPKMEKPTLRPDL